MIDKDITSKTSPGSQLFFLLLFAFFGMLLGTIISTVLHFVMPGSNITDPGFLRISQLISVITIFILPPLACAILFNKEPKVFLKANNKSNIPTYLLVLVLLFACQPVVAALGDFNKSIIPESVTWIHAMEEQLAKTMEILVADKSISGIIGNMFIIALMAGISEELFFRGGMQQLIEKITKNSHLAVWITAFIFSVIHFQFYGFFPRMILGAMLGYLLVWTRSLWVPIIAHTIYNAINLAAMQYFYGTPQYEEMENMKTADIWWAVIIGGLVAATSLYYIFKLNKPEIENSI